MSNAAINQFMIGLPGAGKTTFLAALWHVLFSGKIEGSLLFSHLEGDDTYLNKIQDTWIDTKQLERTQIGMEQSVSITLKHPTLEVTTNVLIPDLSGESFEQQWTDRIADKYYYENIQKSQGGLLLIHPDVRKESLISEAAPLIETISTGGDIDDTDRDDPVQWDAAKSPTQVQLVDLLQFVQTLLGQRGVRLAVVISAWDLVQKDSQNHPPEKWVENSLPLLHQYLTTNSNTFEHKYYGISAQGGDINSDLESLQQIIEPSERIEVVTDGLKSSHDITLPLRWTMGWE